MRRYNRVGSEEVELGSDAAGEQETTGEVEVSVAQVGLPHRKLQVDLDWAVERFKGVACPKEVAAGKNVRVIYKGKMLVDGQTLRQAGLEKNGFLHVAISDHASPVEEPSEDVPIDVDDDVQFRMMLQPPPEGTNADLLLGFLMGFLLGVLALICLWQPRISRKQRTGLLLGAMLSLLFSFLQMKADADQRGSN